MVRGGGDGGREGGREGGTYLLGLPDTMRAVHNSRLTQAYTQTMNCLDVRNGHSLSVAVCLRFHLPTLLPAEQYWLSELVEC